MTTAKRRLVDIEKLLAWTYRQEMPKLELIGASYSPMSAMWELGTAIKDGPGGTPFYESLLDQGNPHEDALIVHETVCELDKLSAEWHDPPETLLSDMPAAVQAEAAKAMANYRVQRAALVMRFSKIGSRPDWVSEVPERKVVCKNGKELWFITREVPYTTPDGVNTVRLVEEDGRDKRKRRAMRGAYRKYEWDPPISLIVDRRADYCHWHASLNWLAEELRPKLLAHEPTGPAAAAMPWEEGEAPGARVLPALDLKAA